MERCKICNESLQKERSQPAAAMQNNIFFYTCPRCKSEFNNLLQPAGDWSWDGISWFNDRHKKMYAMYEKLLQLAPLKKLLQQHSHPRFLDIGCGFGTAMLAAENAGYEAHGVEPLYKVAQYGQQHNQLDIQPVLFNKELFAKDFFDLISVYMVLEHLDDPKKFLANALYNLKPDGYIFIGVPAFDNLWKFFFRLFNHKIIKLDVFREDYHVNYFTKKAIRFLCEELNLKYVQSFHRLPLVAAADDMLNLSPGCFLLQKMR